MERTKYHTIKDGEALWLVAQNYGVTIGKIMAMNRNGNFKTGSRIRVM